MKKPSSFLLAALSLSLVLSSCANQPGSSVTSSAEASASASSSASSLEVKLTGISATGYQSQYHVHDEFSFDGICKARYSDGKEVAITPNTISKPDMEQAGRKEIVLTYSESGIEVSTSYFIEVLPIRLDGLSIVEEVITLTAGSKETLPLVYSPIEATDKSFSYAIEDESVASFDGDTLLAKAPGITTLSIQSHDGSHCDTVIIRVEGVKKTPEVELPDGYFAPNVTTSAASTAFTLLSLDLMSLGYEVYPCIRGEEKGLAYVDEEHIYRSNIDQEVFYCDAGFVSFDVNQTEATAEPSYQKMYPCEEEAFKKKIWYIDSLRVSDLPKDHFIEDGQYIQYQLNGESLAIEAKEKKEENIDVALGSIYDYDKNEYDFIPLSEIPKASFEYTSLVQPLDVDQISATFDQMIETQNRAGLEEKVVSTMFVSLETFSMLNGTLGQKESLNGVLLETIKKMEFDPEKEYLYMNDDGTIAVKDIPHNEGKTFKDWLIDSLIIGAGSLIAITLMVSTGGAGCMLSGAILGAVGEYATQTIFQGKKLSEVNIGKILVSAAMGAFTTGIPLAGSVGDFFLKSLGIAIVEAAGSTVMSLIDGEKDTKKIVARAATDAFFGVALFGIRHIALVRGGHQPETKYTGEEIKLKKIYSHSITEVDESPVLSLVKETNPGSPITNVVSTSSAMGNGTSSIAYCSSRDTLVSSSKQGIKEIIEAIFGM